MNASTDKYIPWELIAESFTSSLQENDRQELELWLKENPENETTYAQIRDLWEHGMSDYSDYKNADEQKSWEHLKAKITSKEKPGLVVDGNFEPKRRLGFSIAGIAALFLGLITVGYWYYQLNHKTIIYQTNEESLQNIALSDGSVISLQPRTEIKVAGDYNQSDRKLELIKGEAFFDVKHMADKPFVVNMGATRIEDIGTSFIIRKSELEIETKVITGKVAFIKTTDHEKRELNAGSSLTYQVKKEIFGEVKSLPEQTTGEEVSLNFENTPLGEAFQAVEKVYKKHIAIESPLADQKITAHLKGMSFDAALKVICQSMGLEIKVSDSTYVIKQKIKN